MDVDAEELISREGWSIGILPALGHYYEHGPAERLTAPGSRVGFAERDRNGDAS